MESHHSDLVETTQSSWQPEGEPACHMHRCAKCVLPRPASPSLRESCGPDSWLPSCLSGRICFVREEGDGRQPTRRRHEAMAKQIIKALPRDRRAWYASFPSPHPALPCPPWHAWLCTHHPLSAGVAKIRVCARIGRASSALQLCLFCASRRVPQLLALYGSRLRCGLS